MNKKKKFLWVPVILILAFIFGQSFLNQNLSNKESEIVKDVVVQPVHQAVTGEKISNSETRKIAHMTEFAVLGLGLAIFFNDKKRILRFLRSISYCGMFALLDESIQFLSDRAPEVFDIWCDILGGAVGAALGILLIIIFGKSNRQSGT